MEQENNKVKIITIENLSYKYPDGTLALDNISVDIFSGDAVAVLGQNGSGKTTLLLTISGVMGEKLPIKLSFCQCDSKNNKMIFSNIGFLFQNPDDQLFSLTVQEEIAFALLNLGLSQSEIKDRIDNIYMKLKINVPLEKEIMKLSFGQKRKIALASILVYEPQLILLDEPTSGLDPRSVDELVDILLQLKNNDKTMVFSTNDLSFVGEVSNKVLILTSEHKLEVFGNTQEILSNKELLFRNNLIRKIGL